MLVGSFAMLGLVLAALGIYGVISYSVTRQTQEIGIRMALGASAAHVRKQVLVSTLRLAVIGIVVGAGLSIGTSRLLASLLYSTSPWDGVTYCAMAVALLIVAALAGYVPALRASRVSPLIALRAE
jgi:ABC-type antimicrobial peptide transport system permease subunit